MKKLLSKLFWLGGILFATGCSSLGGSSSEAVTGQSPSELNWSFADTTAMQAKVSSLQQENARLQRQVLQLKRSLKEADAIVESVKTKQKAVADQQGLATSRTAPKPVQRPVISAPDPEQDLANADDAIQEAPRLVQPTFANAESSFENEAVSDEIELSSVLWGVHLDSYRKKEDARSGWQELQRKNPDELGLLEPRVENVTIAGQGAYLRLIAGGFSAEGTAKKLCKNLTSRGQYCRVVGFSGEHLSLGGRS